MPATSVEGSETVRSSPYKGLVPYSEADAAFFFGRDAECEIVAANLMAARLTLLYGASGVGKSSLLQAGVASYLRREPAVDTTVRRRSDLLVVFNRWTGDPVHDLIEEIRQACAMVAPDRAGPASVARYDSAATLTDTLQILSANLDVDFLIILDQFEEYFLYHEHEDGDGTFAVEFPRAVNRADVPANFLIAMREDQLARLDRFKGRLPQLFDNTLRITHLGHAAARAAILRPLDAYNRLVGGERAVGVQPELIDTILEDVQVGRVQLAEGGQGGTGNGPGEPASNPKIEAPFLQLVMSTLWAEERRQGSQVLRAETLHSLGGAQRIVRTHLDAAMSSLTGEEQDIAAAVFRYLVTPSGSKISYSDHDLAEYAGLPQAVVAPVLHKLSGGQVRILRPVGDQRQGMDGRSYEVFHDVLAPAILDWRTRYAQQRAAEEELALRLESEAEERRAVEQQARLYRRRAQRRGAFVLGMVLVLVVVVALAVVSLQQANAARRANNAAQASALSARASALLATDPTGSARVAADALGRDPTTPDAELVLREALGASHLRQIVSRTGAGVTRAAFSPDGQHIAAVTDKRTITVYDSDTGGRVRATLPVSASSNNFGAPPAFTADGQAVVFWTTSGKAYVWHWGSGSDPTMLPTSNVSATAVATGRDLFATGDTTGYIQLWNSQGERRGERFSLPMDSHVNALALSPDAATLVSGTDLNLSLWSIRSSLPKPVWSHPVNAQSVALSSDDIFVAAAGGGKVSLWAAAGGAPQKFGDVDHLAGSSVKFSPTGRRLAIVRDNVAEVWNARGGSLVELNGHSGGILAIAFSPNGNQIVTAAADATARVWEGLNGGTLLQLRGHAGAVYDASFSPDGNHVLTAGADGTVRMWDVAAGTVLWRHNAAVEDAAFGPMGKTVVTASHDKTSCFISKRGRSRCRHPDNSASAVWDARISSSGKDILTAHEDGTVVVSSVSPKREVARLTWPGLRIRSAAFSASGQLIAAGSGSDLYIWKWRENPFERRQRATTSVLIPDAILDVQFGPGRYDYLVLTAHADGRAWLWDSRTGKHVRPLSAPGADVTYEAKFSPTGDRVVTASGDGIARVWDTASGRRLHELRSVLRRPLTSVNFSPDGAWVVAGDTDGNVMIWDAANDKMLAVLPWHAGAVNSVEFSPDGDGQILSTGDDGTVRLSRCEEICGPVGSVLEAARRLPK